MSGADECHRTRSCHVTKADIQAHCPAGHEWHEKAGSGCLSDCRRYGGDVYCDNPDVASSAFNKDLCVEGYAWPFDDTKTDVIDQCVEATSMKIVFEPIL